MKHIQLVEIARALKASNARFLPSRWLAYINGECGSSGGQIKRRVA